MNHSCPEGYMYDNLVRFAMPVGPFQESAQMDCYLNIVVYQTLAWIQICVTLVFTMVVLRDLPFKRTMGMKAISACILLVFFSSFGILLVSLYRQELTRGLYALGVLSFFLLLGVYVNKLLVTKVQLLKGFTGESSILVLLGGMKFVLPTLLFSLLANLCCILGAIISAIVYDPTNESLSFTFWQIHCGGLFSSGIICVMAVHFLCVKFIAVLENSLETRNIKAGGGSTSGNHESDANIKDLIFRFKLARTVNPLLCLPGFVYIAHIFVLPMFSYLMLLQILNCNCTGILIWYMVTSPSQRRKYLLFGSKTPVGLSQGVVSPTTSRL